MWSSLWLGLDSDVVVCGGVGLWEESGVRGDGDR